MSKTLIAVTESSTFKPDLSSICQKKLYELSKLSKNKILFSWYNNDKETTAWSESKDASIIYIRYLKDSSSPLPRKSRDSHWPLKYSSQKAYQQQEFDIYYAGRSFYGINNNKFTLKDAQQLDKQILNRILKNINIDNITRKG